MKWMSVARLLSAAVFAIATTVACLAPAELVVEGEPRAITDVQAFNLGRNADGFDLLQIDVVSDPSEMVADDELTVALNLAIDDLRGLPVAEPIAIDGERVRVSAFEYQCFCGVDEPSDTGTTEGTLRIDAVAGDEVRGFLDVTLSGQDVGGRDFGHVELRVPFTARAGMTALNAAR